MKFKSLEDLLENGNYAEFMSQIHDGITTPIHRDLSNSEFFSHNIVLQLVDAIRECEKETATKDGLRTVEVGATILATLWTIFSNTTNFEGNTCVN